MPAALLERLACKWSDEKRTGRAVRHVACDRHRFERLGWKWPRPGAGGKPVQDVAAVDHLAPQLSVQGSSLLSDKIVELHLKNA
ncbi:hypothetical protein [Bosea sp. (in: a-proteobacteria)]|uniref:hypothetical protein n=1 Tax=Bosea sp. (in: a-proteobacteria) TaxID=1871050 RepID=UPI002FCC2A57